MRWPWIAAIAGTAACATVLGVDHDYRLSGSTESPGIRCADGGTFCEPLAQVCCLHNAEGSDCESAAPGQEPCQGYTSIRCDDPAQCGDAGLMCCISLNPQQYLLETMCSVSCPDAGGLSLALCNPSAPAPCAPGTSCKILPLGNFAADPEWFHACQ